MKKTILIDDDEVNLRLARGPVILSIHLPRKRGSGKSGESESLRADLLSLPFHKAVAQLEKSLIVEALRDCKGNKTEAAERLQINRRLLYKKIRDYNIDD